ncbi:Eukaryotic translation initiation factor eIF-1 [Tulasnella sp. 417]|nr:Eukaryotic translation initiation factor eIF-1 [Tulasnella sp. 417]
MSLQNLQKAGAVELWTLGRESWSSDANLFVGFGGNLDPFAEGGLDDLEDTVGSEENYLHIRIQQRNGRKSLTTLQGLGKEYDPKKLLKAFKKEFACNGTVVEDDQLGEVIQLQGDQRIKIKNFLVENGILASSIKVHGF